MKQPPREFSEKLMVGTYANDTMVEFAVRPGGPEPADAGVTILIPLPVVYRLYHLGRAYGLDEVERLHPTGSKSFGYYSIAHLISQLEQLLKVLDDAVVRHYATVIANAFRERVNDKSIHLVLHF